MCTQCATITLGNSLPCYSHIHSSHVRIGLPMVKLHGVLLTIMRIGHDSTPASLQSEKKLVVVSMREKTHLGHAVLCDHCQHCVLSLGIVGNPGTSEALYSFVLSKEVSWPLCVFPANRFASALAEKLPFFCLLVCLQVFFSVKKKAYFQSISTLDSHNFIFSLSSHMVLSICGDATVNIAQGRREIRLYLKTWIYMDLVAFFKFRLNASFISERLKLGLEGFSFYFHTFNAISD